jgi:hypothetical protein
MYVHGKMRPVETIPGMRWGRENGEEEFKYDIFDILYELLQMPQCTPTQHNSGKRKERKKIRKG